MRASSKTRRKSPTKTGDSAIYGFPRPVALLGVLLLAVSVGASQNPKPKKGEALPRTLTGIVTLPNDKPAFHAAVLLENTKTKLIVSFYSKEDGSYFFHELSPDVDYKISARLDDAVTPTRTLSAFDSRKDPVINLKLEKKP